MPLLTIIIPCYNEENTILKILAKLNQSPLSEIDKEIIVIDDGSTDETPNLLKNFTLLPIKKFFHTKNLGKTSAIKTGIKNSTGQFIIVQDADLEYEPQDIKKLLDYALKENLPVVYGSRRLNKTNRYTDLFFYLGANFLTLLTNWLYKQKLTDVETCYKLIKVDVLTQIKLESKNFIFENEITAKLSRLGIKIKEIPISYYPRTKKEGKKINFIHGLEALVATIKYRFKK